MDRTKIINNIVNFLIDNGFQVDNANFDESYEFTHYVKNNYIGVDISDSEIVLIDDTGDFARHSVGHGAMFWLIGQMVCFNDKIGVEELNLGTVTRRD